MCKSYGGAYKVVCDCNDYTIINRWHWKDVKSCKPEWSDDRCKKWIENNSREFNDRLTEMGWDVMGIMINECEG